MLKHIDIKNFKAWEHLELSFGKKVTGLFGTNSSGKSSLLQMLLLLKQSKNTTDRNMVLDFGNTEKLVNLGSYKDVIHQHNEDKHLSWSLEWQTKKVIKISDTSKSSRSILFKGNQLKIQSDTYLTKNILLVKFFRYFFDGYQFEICKNEQKTSEFQLSAKRHNSKQTRIQSAFHFTRTRGRNWALPKPIKTYLFPDQAKTYYQNADFLSIFESEYETLMDRIYYLGPLREFPKRQYQWSGSSPEGVGNRGERTVDAILAATMKGEKRNLGKRKRYKSFQEIIAYWLKALGLIHAFRIAEIAPNTHLYQTLVTKEAGASEVALTDVGFGVSQVLPVLVLLYYVPKRSIVLIEQPEIHLHPAVQSKLADLMINIAETRNLQIVVESHSEHLLRRLQLRVAEEKISTADLKLYFFKTKRGKAHYDALNLDEYGNILNWPEHFFGNEMEDILSTRKAALLRKKAVQAKNNDHKK